MNRERKIAEVVSKLDKQTPYEKFQQELAELQEKWRKEKEQINIKYELMKQSLELDLEQAQDICQHTDDGSMFYGLCKKCGYHFG